MDNLNSTMDAKIWVKEWLRIVKENPELPFDEGAMLAWFSNSIMAGYDIARLRINKKMLHIRIFNSLCYCITAGSLLWLLFGSR